MSSADFLTFEPTLGLFANCFVCSLLAEQFQRVRFQISLSEQKFVHILIGLVHTPADDLVIPPFHPPSFQANYCDACAIAGMTR